MSTETYKQTTIRIPSNLMEEVKIYAGKENLSVNKYIISALITAVFNSKKTAAGKTGKTERHKKEKNLSDIMMRR